MGRFSNLHKRTFNSLFSVTRPRSCFFVLIMPHQKVLFYHIYFCMKNWKSTQYNLSKNVYLSFSACFIFFFVIFSCRKTISWASDFKRYLFTLYHIISLPISVLSRLRYVSWSSPPPWLFNGSRAQLYVKDSNHM